MHYWCIIQILEINREAAVTVIVRNSQTLQLTHLQLGERDHSVEATSNELWGCPARQKRHAVQQSRCKANQPLMKGVESEPTLQHELVVHLGSKSMNVE